MCIIKTYREEKMRKLNNKHIFVSVEPGGADGYKLARVLATMPCMHWYSCEENGIMPWNITNTTNRNKHHFDRITPKGILPPTHDYVEKYMPNEKQYYKLFDELFAANGGEDIINDGKRVIYCTHSMPNKIRFRVPKNSVSVYTGNKRENIRYIQDRFEFDEVFLVCEELCKEIELVA
jgi:hypothetical protein